MPQESDLSRHAFAAHVAQHLGASARAIDGFQELAFEQARELGLSGILPDLGKVRDAAGDLNRLLDRMLAKEPEAGAAGTGIGFGAWFGGKKPALILATSGLLVATYHLARINLLHEVPVLCVPIVAGRTDGLGAGAQADRTSVFWQASRWGSVIPTLWSFMLALRARGLGSAWTTLTLFREREMAELLDIPFDEWMQVGLFPIAYTRGTDFAVTPRAPGTEHLRWNGYQR